MIQIVSANLNTFGDRGQFEADASTWGFGYDNTDRSGDFSHSGLYSLRLGNGDSFDFDFENAPSIAEAKIPIARASANGNAISIGEKIVVSIWVFTPNNSPIASSFSYFLIENIDGVGLTKTSEVRKTVADATGSWVQVKAFYDITGSFTANFNLVLVSGMDSGFHEGRIIQGGSAYIDDFEIFKYIDIIQTCTLAIDVPHCIITGETSIGANDGTATIAITGGIGPFKYSKDDGVSWQPSNFFAGLSPGAYPFKVMDTAMVSCIASHNFAIPSGYSSWISITTTPNDESTLGASDGSILITVVGTTGPWTFSLDGLTYQSLNIFSSLTSGTYVVYVKDSNEQIYTQNVTINPGRVIFENVYFHKNHITTKRQAASNWSSLTNYRLHDDVRVEDDNGSGIFNSKLKVSLTPSSDGSVLFQVREAFRKGLDPIPPALNTNTIVKLTDRIKHFRHYTGEVQNTDIVPSSLTASLVQLVMWGGIDKFNFPSIDYFNAYVPTHKNFFTWAPPVKKVDRLQEDYLNFWVYKPQVTIIKLCVKAYFDDGTNQTNTTSEKSGCNYGDLYQIPAGPLNSGAASIDVTKNLIRYELWIVDQNNVVISEVRTYILDLIRKPNLRLFMFLNSLGSFEVLPFYGQSAMTGTFERQIITKHLAPGYSGIGGEKQLNRILLTNQYNYSSGFFKGVYAQQWLDYMRDLMLSPRVYEVTNGTRKPIVIASGVVEREDQNYQYFLRFTVEDSFTNQSYTPTL